MFQEPDQRLFSFTEIVQYVLRSLHRQALAVHDPEKTVVIRLRDEQYSRLVVEVEDPPTTVEAIRERLKE